jgi:hypothetical protein
MQIEDVADQHFSTNIVSNTVYWNVIGCCMALFILFFDDVIRMGSVSSPTVTSVIFGNGESAVLKIFTGLLFAVLCVIPIFVQFTWVNTPFIVVPLIAFSLIFVFLAALAIVTEDTQNVYATKKNLIFWFAFIVSIPVVVHSLHMLLQRRDQVLNWTAAFAVVAAGLCAAGIEFLQAAVSLGSSADKDMELVEDKKKNVVMVVMTSILVIILLLTSSSFAWFPASAFSNAYYSVAVVTALLMIPVLVFPGRYLTKTAMAVSTSEVCNLWSNGLIMAEMMARFIFTVAVLADVWGIHMHDFVLARGH